MIFTYSQLKELLLELKLTSKMVNEEITLSKESTMYPLIQCEDPAGSPIQSGATDVRKDGKYYRFG